LKRILEQACGALAKRVAAPSYRQNPITRSLNALALLASGNPEYLPLVRKEAQWASDHSVDAMATWYYGYVSMATLRPARKKAGLKVSLCGIPQVGFKVPRCKRANNGLDGSRSRATMGMKNIKTITRAA
jgi:hypothetical protein